jgi:hypothetical protein
MKKDEGEGRTEEEETARAVLRRAPAAMEGRRKKEERRKRRAEGRSTCAAWGCAVSGTLWRMGICCEISLPGNSFGIQANCSISRSKSEKAF